MPNSPRTELKRFLEQSRGQLDYCLSNYSKALNIVLAWYNESQASGQPFTEQHQAIGDALEMLMEAVEQVKTMNEALDAEI